MSDADTLRRRVECELTELKSDDAGLRRAGVGLAEVGKKAVQGITDISFTVSSTAKAIKGGPEALMA